MQLKHFYAYLEHANIPLSGMVNRHYYVSLNGSDFDESSEEVQMDQVEGRYFGLRELFDKAAIPCFFLAKCVVRHLSFSFDRHFRRFLPLPPLLGIDFDVFFS